jgi:glycosyltransferase involved in cell wall biosynthesis
VDLTDLNITRLRTSQWNGIRKPTVLVLVRHYLPGYKCGPIRSIANLVGALGAELDFRVVTLDRDVGDTAPYPDVRVDGSWHSVGCAHVLYLSPAQRSAANLARILRHTPHDALYLNSAFDPHFALRPLILRRLGLVPRMPCLIAPRGEFSPGALQLKAWKKRPFLEVARMTGLYKGLTWQASSRFERQDIERVLGAGASDVEIAHNITARSVADGIFSSRQPGKPLRVCFLSRISPKKNLIFALEVLRRVQQPVRFDIYGPIEDERYWSRCQRAIQQLPDSVIASYGGSVAHADVLPLLAGYDLYFLPTLGENFGHSIYEALAAGTPVLIADTTPFRELAGAGAGWELPLADPDAFVRTIELVAAFPDEEHAKMRRCAQALAALFGPDAPATEETSRLFARVLSG